MHACEICQFSFAYKANLVRHQQAHRSGKKIECKTCGSSFYGMAVYRAHICCQERVQKKALKQERLKLQKLTPRADPTELVECRKCGENFSGIIGYRSHLCIPNDSSWSEEMRNTDATNVTVAEIAITAIRNSSRECSPSPPPLLDCLPPRTLEDYLYEAVFL